jgi:hypothetical protein
LKYCSTLIGSNANESCSIELLIRTHRPNF